MRYLLQLRVISIRERNGIFWFADHVEQSADFDDMLVVDVESAAGGGIPKAWAKWASNVPILLRTYEPEREPLADEDPDAGEWQATASCPLQWVTFSVPDASVRLTVRSRRPADDLILPAAKLRLIRSSPNGQVTELGSGVPERPSRKGYTFSSSFSFLPSGSTSMDARPPRVTGAPPTRSSTSSP